MIILLWLRMNGTEHKLSLLKATGLLMVFDHVSQTVHLVTVVLTEQADEFLFKFPDLLDGSHGKIT